MWSPKLLSSMSPYKPGQALRPSIIGSLVMCGFTINDLNVDKALPIRLQDIGI